MWQSHVRINQKHGIVELLSRAGLIHYVDESDIHVIYEEGVSPTFNESPVIQHRTKTCGRVISTLTQHCNTWESHDVTRQSHDVTWQSHDVTWESHNVTWQSQGPVNYTNTPWGYDWSKALSRVFQIVTWPFHILCLDQSACRADQPCLHHWILVCMCVCECMLILLAKMLEKLMQFF